MLLIITICEHAFYPFELESEQRIMIMIIIF